MAKHCISLGAALLGINALGLGQVRFSFELCCPFQYLKHLYGYTDFVCLVLDACTTIGQLPVLSKGIPARCLGIVSR